MSSARLAIEVAGRLVATRIGGVVHDGARDRDALLLPARELARVVVHPVFEADDAERGLRALLPLGAAEAREEERELQPTPEPTLMLKMAWSGGGLELLDAVTVKVPAPGCPNNRAGNKARNAVSPRRGIS